MEEINEVGKTAQEYKDAIDEYTAIGLVVDELAQSKKPVPIETLEKLQRLRLQQNEAYRAYTEAERRASERRERQ